MKTIFKALLLLIALLTSVSVFAQSDFDSTKVRAEAGDAQAQYDLGVMYAKGRGVAQDDQEAVKWYRLAAEQGDAEAQYGLGWMYASGTGVAQDDQEAVIWHRLAAEQGLANGQYFLGVMYQYGKGVAQNDQEALKWYKLAAQQGHAGAQNNLARLSSNLASRSQTTATASNNAARNCTSNAQEINRQVQNLSQAYAARFEDLESRNLRDRLNCMASSNLIAISGRCSQDVNREFDMQVEQLNLQKTRDIADLRSRIVEICDSAPVPQVTSDDIERGTNIATALQELSALHDSGALTDEEFQAAKRRVLGLD